MSTMGMVELVVQSAVAGRGAPGRTLGGPSTKIREQPEDKTAIMNTSAKCFITAPTPGAGMGSHPDTGRVLPVIKSASQLSVILAMLAWGGAAPAQQPLVADRPDFTEATSTVGRGVLQFEFGYTFGLDDADGVTARAHSYGEPLLRAGFLADRLEFRVGAGAVTLSSESHGHAATESGLEDLYLGVKVALNGADPYGVKTNGDGCTD